MVLNPSDYSLPEPGESYDPTSVRDFVPRLAGLVIAFTVVAWAWETANSTGTDLMNRLTSKLGFTSGGGTGPEVF